VPDDRTRRFLAGARELAPPMTRDRLFGRRWLVWPVVVWGVLMAASPRLGEALPLPPARDSGGAGESAVAPSPLEHRLVKARLSALGLSAADAAALWERLTPLERMELAARADELETGGDPVAAGVAIAIIVAMVVILALELIGRRVISRP
jgi:hypothetical protein